MEEEAGGVGGEDGGEVAGCGGVREEARRDGEERDARGRRQREERSAPGRRSASAAQTRATLPRMTHDGGEEGGGDAISSRRRHAGKTSG